MEIIRKDFNAIEKKFTELSNEQEFIKEVGFCLNLIGSNPQLQKCTKNSLLSSVYQVASVGLSLNPIKKEAYLIPRWSRANGMEAQLMPSYQGLIKLVTDTGSVKSINCNIVYEGDEFDLDLGTEQRLTHKPKFKSKKIQLVYAIATLPDGSNQIEVMPFDDICEIRGRSDAYMAYKAGKMKTTVWVTDEGEMCRKTVLRRIVKYLPKTDKWEMLRTAISQDEQEFTASYQIIDRIQDLLKISSIDPEESAQIESEIRYGLNMSRAKEILLRLEGTETDTIESGRNYSQTDIKKKV